MTRWLFVRKPIMKNIMKEQRANPGPAKTLSYRDSQIVPRFSNHVEKGGMKTIGKDSPAAREPIVNKTKNTSEITKDNTVKTTGNGSTNIGDLIMPGIKNRSGKDFVTKNREK